jgi:hypothetical protein
MATLDTLQDSVNTLTSSTTSLLDEVNVNKSTLTDSKNAAEAAAAQVATLVGDFNTKYIGSDSADPTVDGDGNPLVAGALYFNSAANELRVYDGSTWGGLSAGSLSETVTDISFNDTTKVLSYTDENGTPTNIDLSAAFVDTDTTYTDAEIKTKYESNSDTNAYTDAEKTKLAGIDDNANNYSLPNASNTVVGGVKMRYDSGTDTLYLTNDGTDA